LAAYPRTTWDIATHPRLLFGVPVFSSVCDRTGNERAWQFAAHVRKRYFVRAGALEQLAGFLAGQVEVLLVREQQGRQQGGGAAAAVRVKDEPLD
jgi:hypothetical protein